MSTSRIVLLAGPGPTTRIVRHALRERFGPVAVVLERPVSTARLVRRRVRTLGPAAVFGQLVFGAVVSPVLKRAGARRIREILDAHALTDASMDGDVIDVPSVNGEAARDALRRLDPAVVVVNGTRIIGRDTLRAVDAPFVNMHAGITPAFRGVHGAYWALAEDRASLAGVTVHYVDEGIDTGGIIAQACIAPGRDDSFATYPYLQLAAGLPLLLDAVDEILVGRRPPARSPSELGSRLWSHPTAWGYVWRRVARGIR